MPNALQYIMSALRGPAQARAAHRQALMRHPGIEEGIRQLEIASPVSSAADDDAPIFLFSAGWLLRRARVIVENATSGLSRRRV